MWKRSIANGAIRSGVLPVATKQTPSLIAPFALERFYKDELVSELAAAAVSH